MVRNIKYCRTTFPKIWKSIKSTGIRHVRVLMKILLEYFKNKKKYSLFWRE